VKAWAGEGLPDPRLLVSDVLRFAGACSWPRGRKLTPLPEQGRTRADPCIRDRV